MTCSKSRRRAIPIADYHRLPGDEPWRDNTLKPGELVTGIDLPAGPSEQLVIAESTVKTHVSHLMKKYDVPSRLKLVVAVHKTQGA